MNLTQKNEWYVVDNKFMGVTLHPQKYRNAPMSCRVPVTQPWRIWVIRSQRSRNVIKINLCTQLRVHIIRDIIGMDIISATTNKIASYIMANFPFGCSADDWHLAKVFFVRILFREYLSEMILLAYCLLAHTQNPALGSAHPIVCSAYILFYDDYYNHQLGIMIH